MENQIVLKKTQNELSFKLHVQARAYNLRISSKKLIKLLFELVDNCKRPAGKNARILWGRLLTKKAKGHQGILLSPGNFSKKLIVVNFAPSSFS